MLSKRVQGVKKTFRAPESFSVPIRVKKKIKGAFRPFKEKNVLEPEKFFIVISVSALWWHAAAEQALRHKSRA